MLGEGNTQGSGAWTDTVASGSSGFLKMYKTGSVSGIVPQNYIFRFTLGYLYNLSDTPGYKSITSLYDWRMLRKVVISLKPQEDPRRMLTQTMQTPASVQYDLTGAVGFNPDVTFVDYDGINLLTASPSDNDVTEFVYNRPGARLHRAFRAIRRTFYPKCLSFVMSTTGMNANPNKAPTNINQLSTSAKRRQGFVGAADNIDYTGMMMLAISNKSPLGAGTNTHPKYNYSLEVKWFVTHKGALYG